MPLARMLLFLASTSVDVFAGAAANVDCARIRAGNTRLLHITDDGAYGPYYLNDHSGLIAAGWRLGVLQADLVRALVEWRPTYLMYATVRALENVSSADVQTAVQTLRCSLGAEELWEERVSKTLLVAAAARIGIRTPWTWYVPAECKIRKSEISQLTRRLAPLRVIQQYLTGPTLAYDGTALDGQILGGFARAEAAAKLLDGVVLGMGDSPLVRLWQAVSGELPLSHFAANWYTHLAHSIVSLTVFMHSPHPPSDLMYYPSVYTAFPTQLAEYEGSTWRKTTTLITDEHNQGLQCRYMDQRHQPGLSIQLMCGRPGASVCTQLPACKPLAMSTPVPTIADVLARLCEPEYNWRLFAHCAARARAEQEADTDARAAAFTLGPYDDGYWARNGLSLCRDMRHDSYEDLAEPAAISFPRPRISTRGL
ncbi:hypothetical protein T492DRAFT_887163 [Pavlovales sp. CCMP2436]|nr:hypothetical protein T492DRAFT_887163 [Pavlovales sp. CCMP2436]